MRFAHELRGPTGRAKSTIGTARFARSCTHHFARVQKRKGRSLPSGLSVVETSGSYFPPRRFASRR
ncbi:MAG TPA: hypothetical protein VF997_12785, partial [Polyangia bacterium]